MISCHDDLTGYSAQEIREMLALTLAEQRCYVHVERKDKHALHGDRQRQFIETFVAAGAIATYPVVETDLIDENNVDFSSEPPEQPELFRWVGQMTLVQALTQEIGRAAECCRMKIADPREVVDDLFRSRDEPVRRHLLDLPLPLVTIERVLAHVECLGFAFPPRLSVSIARRVTMALQNKHRFRPAKPKRSKDDQGKSA